MFKKTKIAAILAASVAATSAQAVHINPDGLGQVLIFPYYRVSENYATPFQIRNSMNQFKAVKIRFRDGRESHDILDFNVYLTPFDVWQGQIQMIDGEPVVWTRDTTCTMPIQVDYASVETPWQEFNGGRYLPFRDNFADPSDFTEGYIEVIEMGILDGDMDERTDFPRLTAPNGVVISPSVLPTDPLFNTYQNAVMVGGKDIAELIWHDPDQTPEEQMNDCKVLRTAWEIGIQTNGANDGFTEGGALVDKNGGNNEGGGDQFSTYRGPITGWGPIEGPSNLATPQGGLTGWSAVARLDLDDPLTFTTSPIALDNYARAVRWPESQEEDDNPLWLTGAQHYLPSTAFVGQPEWNYELPSLASGNTQTSEITNDVGGARIVTYWPTVNVDKGFYDPINQTLGYSVQTGVNPFPVAHALAVQSLNGSYYIPNEGGELGQTDWVFTLPMRKHGIFSGTRYTVTASNNIATGVDHRQAYNANTDGLITLGGHYGSTGATNNYPKIGDFVADGFNPLAVLQGGYWDQEEQAVILPDQPSPPDPNADPLCSLPGAPSGILCLDRETNVVTVTGDDGSGLIDDTGVLEVPLITAGGEADILEVQAGFNGNWERWYEGWMQLAVARANPTAADPLGRVYRLDPTVAHFDEWVDRDWEGDGTAACRTTVVPIPNPDRVPDDLIDCAGYHGVDDVGLINAMAVYGRDFVGEHPGYAPNFILNGFGWYDEAWYEGIPMAATAAVRVGAWSESLPFGVDRDGQINIPGTRLEK